MGLTEFAELLSAPDGAAPHAGRDAAQLRVEMFGRLAAVVWATFAALRGRPKEYFGTPQCFELFGMDVMFDASLRCWLLEFNALPALETLSEDEREALLDDVISLAVDPQQLATHQSLQRLQKAGADMRRVHLLPVQPHHRLKQSADTVAWPTLARSGVLQRRFQTGWP